MTHDTTRLLQERLRYACELLEKAKQFMPEPIGHDKMFWFRRQMDAFIEGEPWERGMRE